MFLLIKKPVQKRTIPQLLISTKDYDKILQLDTNNIIHVIWFQGYENLPEKYQQALQKYLDNNPNWHIILWEELQMEKTRL